MIPVRSAKGPYSLPQAAEALGVSVEQLRSLIRNHIVETDEDLANLPVANLQPSDLLVLRLLCKQAPDSTSSY
jgi:hypothetical protein